jgi:hypothetical protein
MLTLFREPCRAQRKGSSAARSRHWQLGATVRVAEIRPPHGLPARVVVQVLRETTRGPIWDATLTFRHLAPAFAAAKSLMREAGQ